MEVRRWSEHGFRVVCIDIKLTPSRPLTPQEIELLVVFGIRIITRGILITYVCTAVQAVFEQVLEIRQGAVCFHVFHAAGVASLLAGLDRALNTVIPVVVERMGGSSAKREYLRLLTPIRGVKVFKLIFNGIVILIHEIGF